MTALIPLAAAALPYVLDSFKSGGGGAQGGFAPQSTLNKRQRGVHKQLTNAATGPGAGGAYGDVADYYRSNLSNNPEDFGAFAQPELRRFNEEIIPGLSEQFAGFGAGGSGLSSSGFRNAAVNAGTDLTERLANIRANLRQSSAQGLFNVGQAALNPVQQNYYMQGQPGFAESAAPGAGNAITQYAGDWWKNMPKVGQKTSPYGGGGSNTASSYDTIFRNMGLTGG